VGWKGGNCAHKAGALVSVIEVHRTSLEHVEM